MRVAVLAANGAPSLSGSNHGYVTDSAIKLGVTVELRQGADLEQVNACGQVCDTFKQADRIKRLNLALDLCQWDAQLIALLTGGNSISSAGVSVGYQFPSSTGLDPYPVCIEGWTKAWQGTQQATPAFTSPSPAYMHWVFPFVQWSISGFTLENQLQVLSLSGAGKQNPNITVNGPFDDWPAVVSAAGGMYTGGWFYDAALPQVKCDYITTTSAAS
jgi:hypothetical protein